MDKVCSRGAKHMQHLHLKSVTKMTSKSRYCFVTKLDLSVDLPTVG